MGAGTLTFEEQAAELHQVEAVALAVAAEGSASGRTPEQQLAEIRRRIHASRQK